MDKKELQRRAGIIEDDNIKSLWSEFSRISEQLTRALKRTDVYTQGGRAPEGMLNPLQVNDIESHMNMLEEELNRLDQEYQWRRYMIARKSRM